MTLYLKKIKYFFLNHKFTGHFYLIVKLFFNGKIFNNIIFRSKFVNLGRFAIKINIFDFEEIKLLNNNNYDHPNIQSFRNFNLKNNIFLFKTKNNLIKNFFHKTLKAKILSNFKAIDQNKSKKNKYIIFADNLNFIDKAYLKKIDKVFLNKNSNIHLDNFHSYNYIQGRIFPLGNSYPSYYKLFSKKKIDIREIKKKVSGFSTIKNFDIFPFDLAYESILPYVNEFILGIDSSSFNKKYQKILDDFLNRTKYKKKITCKFFDFNSDTTLKMKVRGRWITDANNKIINECKGEYCFYIQADEIFPKISKKEFNNFFSNNPDEIYLNFLHFVYDLQTIIKPEKSSYTKAIRLFKKNLYAASHDGFSFHNLTPYRPKIFQSQISINHISYVFDFKKKLKEHYEKKDGLHINQISKKKFIKDYIIPQKVPNIKKQLIHLKHMKSFDKIN